MEGTANLKMGEFGVFVVFTALYAAGTLGLPEIPLLQYRIKPGEMPSPFVAIFGYPAILGLALGHFIAGLGAHSGPVDVLSPAIGLVGLVIIYRLGRQRVLAGSIAYVIITSLWISYVLIVSLRIPQAAAFSSAFSGQFIAVMIGYVFYRLLGAARALETTTPRAVQTSQTS